MTQTFTKYAGMAQAAIGLLGQFAPGVGSLLGAEATGGNTFNILSGAALSYLGFKGNDSSQRLGAQAIGGLNAVVGLLGAFHVESLAGIPLNQGTLSTIINLAIGAWGLYAGFAKKPAGATAH
jgi:hypothetical protein